MKITLRFAIIASLFFSNHLAAKDFYLQIDATLDPITIEKPSSTLSEVSSKRSYENSLAFAQARIGIPLNKFLDLELLYASNLYSYEAFYNSDIHVTTDIYLKSKLGLGLNLHHTLTRRLHLFVAAYPTFLHFNKHETICGAFCSETREQNTVTTISFATGLNFEMLRTHFFVVEYSRMSDATVFDKYDFFTDSFRLGYRKDF